MGALNGESVHELDDESPYSLEKETRKLRSPKIEHGSSSGNSQASSNVMLRNVYKSIKIVVFSNKLNLLIPFGPIAIIVKKLNGGHVSCPCLELFVSFFKFVVVHFVEVDCRLGSSF